MHRRLNLFACLAMLGSLALAAPSLAAVDPVDPSAHTFVQAHDCAAVAGADAFAVQMLFTESEDLTSCEPRLLAATGLCLEPLSRVEAAHFDPVPDSAALNCLLTGRSPPS